MSKKSETKIYIAIPVMSDGEGQSLSSSDLIEIVKFAHNQVKKTGQNYSVFLDDEDLAIFYGGHDGSVGYSKVSDKFFDLFLEEKNVQR